MEKRVNPHILTSEVQIERLCARENWVNPYEVLLLGPEASDEAIKAKFQKFSLILHPDRCRDERALQAFQIMESAYRTLQDPEKKSTYVRIMREARERIEFERKKENRRREMLGLAKLPEDTFDSEVRDMSNRIFREIDEKKFHFDKYDWLAKKRQRDEEDKRREEEERKNNEEKEWERSRDKRVNQWRKFTMKKDHKSVKNRMKTFEMKPPSTKPEERPSNVKF
jgi:DnaJ homolog subfamily C member 8